MIAAALVLPAAGALGACGGSDEDSSAPALPPVANAKDFPAGKGQTVEQLREGLPQGPVLAPSVSVLDRGSNRFGFAIFDRARKQITDATVALYTASAKGEGVRGPFPARSESLAVKPQFAARTTLEDPDSAKSVYVAQVPFGNRGTQTVVALARLDGRIVASGAAPVRVGWSFQPPRVGERAIAVDTPTRASVAGDMERIETRIPPDTQHEVSLAEVLGKQPVVLSFATPQLCQSRVCGPVVDIAEQQKATWGGRGVAFVHMEIFEGNKLTTPPRFRPQVAKWRLPSEPWTFVIGADGRVAARFEGAYSADELERALRDAVDGS